jgi:signal transduction histidine kinase/ActR/RegA family two-component response regulator
MRRVAATSEAQAPAFRVGVYTVDRVLKGGWEQGCGVGSDPGGAPVFLRWCSAADDARCRDLVREYRCLEEVADHGVPRPLDLVWTNDRVAVVTVWVAGSALSDSSEFDVDLVALALARILTKAHAAGWVHGDIKPSNILIGSSGAVTLVDWELCRPAGETASPGTLGYAPAHAWENGYTADPKNDVYSAAIVIWECIHRRRAFPNAASEIRAAQREFRFSPDAGRLGPAAGLLRAAAADCALGQLEDAALVLAADLGTVERASLCAELGLKFERDLAPCLLSATAVLSVQCGAWYRDWARGAESVAASELRRNGHSAVEAHAVANWVDERCRAAHSAGEPTTPSSLWQSSATAVMERLETANVTVVAANRSTYGDHLDRLVWIRDRSKCAGSRAAIRCLRLERSTNGLLSPPQAVMRVILRGLVGVSEPPPPMLQRAGRVNPFSITSLAEQLADGARSSSGRGSLAVHNGTARGTEVPCSAFGARLTRAEFAAAGGEVSAAYRDCVAATTEMFSGGVPESVDAVRLAEVWLDIGQPDAALATIDATRRRVDISCLAVSGRALSALGRYPECERVASEMLRLRPQDAATQVAAARLTALSMLHHGQLRAARSAVLQVRRLRKAVQTAVRLELDIARATVLRRRQRYAAASRLLRRSEEIAVSTGAVRLAVICQANSLLNDRVRPRHAVAAGWEDVLRGACAWGMSGLAQYAAGISARIWFEIGDYARGGDVLTKFAARGWCAVHRDSEVHSQFVSAMASWLDRMERVGAVSELCRGVDVGEGGVRRALLAVELPGLLSDYHLPIGVRDRVVRTARVALKVSQRKRETSAQRICVIAVAASDEYVRGSGLSAHTLRALGPMTSRVWVDTLERLRERARSCSDATVLALAAHAIAIANDWGVTPPSIDWFASSASSEVGSRPDGVRAWEWAVARLRVVSAQLREPVEDESSEAVVRHLEVFAAELPRDLEGAFLRRVAPTILPIRLVRGVLEQCGALRGVAVEADAELSLRARSHALERVLRAALRLRSSGSVDDVLRETVSGVLEVSRAERAVVLFDLGGGGARAKVGTHLGVHDLVSSQAEISHSVLARVRDSVGAVVFDDAAAEETLEDRPSVRRYKPRSLIVCPLRTPTRYLGYLYVENRSRPRSFGDADREMVEGFAAQAALALENASLVEDLRESYRDLSRARSEAVRSENLRVLGRLATEVAHDLNNLLTAILGESQLLLLNPRVRDAYASLRVIERAAQDGAECIRRIQESTRSRKEAEFQEVDLADVAKAVLEFTRVRCASRTGEPSVRTELQVDGPSSVLGVACELREVLTNLVINGIDAMPQGGTLAIEIRTVGDSVETCIKDTGRGIAPDVLPRLFEPFFTTKGERGNGLGLSISQSVVRRHGGEITVESELGHGTSMRVRIPRVRGSDWAPPSAIGRSAWETPDATRRRFLIVDDDPSVLRVLGQILEQVGADVESVVGGDAALAKLGQQASRYDCVITDLYMPNVSGLDVVECVHRCAPDTPIVVMSGCSTTLESEATRERGIARVLRKPFAIEAIRELVSSTSARRP